jgi:bifunctional oligoribonuclease and PAP phosphatase NrnA
LTSHEKELYTKLKKLITQSLKVVLLTHINPDGDAIGSILGLYWFLVKRGCNVSMATPNHFPHYLKWMEGADQILDYSKEADQVSDKLKEADLIFFLDLNEPDRLGGISKTLKDLDVLTVMIDHHPDPANFADYMISEISASSTAELVYQFICKLDGQNLVDRRIAECLYTGILTDTGCFSFNSSNPDTFGIVADLLNKGIDKDSIYSQVYDNYTSDRMRLLGYSLKDKMVVLPDIRTAYIGLNAEELRQYNHQIGDTEGFVNYPFMVRDIRITALFLEKKDHIKISFRSKGNFRINRIAQEYFNGGGHMNAAGGESIDSLQDTLARFEEIITQHADEIRSLP